MSTEANKAVARRYFEEFLNQGRGVGGEDLFAPTYRCHFPGRPGPLDKQEHDHLSITFLSAFPDGHFTVEDMIAEGDRVVSRYTFRGTHQETWILLGPSPTGKRITLTGNEIHRVADGRIVEQWSQFDTLQLKLFDPIRTTVQIKQKTIKHTPADKLYDAFISRLSAAHGLVEINTRLRTDLALRDPLLAEVRVPSSRWCKKPMSACTTENVTQLQHALDEIYRQHSQSVHHDYQANFQLLDVDMSGLPCGPKAAFARHRATLLGNTTAGDGKWVAC